MMKIFEENPRLRSDFDIWQNKICKEEEAAKDLVRNAKEMSGRKFVMHLEKELRISKIGEIWNLKLPKNRSKNEFTDPPIEPEEEIYKLWPNIGTRNARDQLFWTLAHMTMLKAGIIEPDYLWDDDKEDFGTSNPNSRIILRRLGGVPNQIRGHNTAMLDCPTARGWWRRKVASEVVEEFTQIDIRVAHEAVHNNAIWSKFVSHTTSQLVILSDEKMRAAIVVFLTNNMEKIKTGEKMQYLLRRVALLGSGRQFTAMGSEACYALVEEAAVGIEEVQSTKVEKSDDGSVENTASSS